MQRHLVFIFVTIACIPSQLFSSSPFTVKRSKRGPSTATLQEKCCEGFGELLQSTAQLLQSIGIMQRQAIDAIGGYAKSDKESWCYQADKLKLSQCKEKIEHLNGKVEALHAECDALLRELVAS